jgi:hypothetical protein
MKTWILPIAVLGAVALTACERTVVTPPNAAVVTPAPSSSTTVVPVPVPGPAGAPGAPGPQGAPGKPGESSTVVVTPPPADAPKTN